MSSEAAGKGTSDKHSIEQRKSLANVSRKEKMYTTIYGRFTKTVIAEGDVEEYCRPMLRSQCNISYVEVNDKDNNLLLMTTKHDDQNHQSQRKNENVTVTIGLSENFHSKILESMLMTMKRGETSHFHIRRNQSKGAEVPYSTEDEKTDWVDVENEQQIVLVLHSFVNDTPIWQLNFDEKYELSLCHKNKGTCFFQENRIEAAFYQYSLALKYLIVILPTQELSESQHEKYNSLKCICYLNLAACQLKYENYDSVVDNCTKALGLDSWNVKGLYRRALAYKNMGNIDQARSDLIKVMKRQPKNKVAGDLLESLMPSNIASSLSS